MGARELHPVDGPSVGLELAFGEEVSVHVGREEDLLEDKLDGWST